MTGDRGSNWPAGQTNVSHKPLHTVWQLAEAGLARPAIQLAAEAVQQRHLRGSREVHVGAPPRLSLLTLHGRCASTPDHLRRVYAIGAKALSYECRIRSVGLRRQFETRYGDPVQLNSYSGMDPHP